MMVKTLEHLKNEQDNYQGVVRLFTIVIINKS